MDREGVDLAGLFGEEVEGWFIVRIGHFDSLFPTNFGIP